MATTDAIAYLGKTLIALLQDRLTSLGLVVNVNDVFLATPDNFKDLKPTDPTVTVFLYHVGVNGEMRNVPRGSSVKGNQQFPALPLDLRFLITPWTIEPGDSYRLIGAIAQLFYDRAILYAGDLLDGGTSVWGADDTVEIILESLPVEEHYDIWDPTDIPYRLSLTYLARVIGIDSALTNTSAPVAQGTFVKGVR
jgi:hypothetical protein